MKDERKSKFLRAFSESTGIVLSACEAAGISRSTYYKWMREDPEFKQEVDDIAEVQLDFVESKLIQLINSGDTSAIIFYLKTKGKRRGYSDKAQQPMPSYPVLPEPSSEEERKCIERSVKNKKDYIVKLLKKQGKYTPELTYQVHITAQILIKVDILWTEMGKSGYSPVNIEYSREGNERRTVNPTENLFRFYASLGLRALRALGMDIDGMDIGGNDTLDEFMKAMREEDV